MWHNPRHQRRAQDFEDERQAALRVRCMPLLDAVAGFTRSVALFTPTCPHGNSLSSDSPIQGRSALTGALQSHLTSAKPAFRRQREKHDDEVVSGNSEKRLLCCARNQRPVR